MGTTAHSPSETSAPGRKRSAISFPGERSDSLIGEDQEPHPSIRDILSKATSRAKEAQTRQPGLWRWTSRPPARKTNLARLEYCRSRTSMRRRSFLLPNWSRPSRANLGNSSHDGGRSCLARHFPQATTGQRLAWFRVVESGLCRGSCQPQPTTSWLGLALG